MLIVNRIEERAGVLVGGVDDWGHFELQELRAGFLGDGGIVGWATFLLQHVVQLL